MCFDSTARPPIEPIAGGALDTRDMTLTSADGTVFGAFAARAAEPTGVGIVILPDIRGLHTYYKELAVRCAENGMDTVAFDYFGRTAGVGERGDDFEWQPHVAATKANQIRDDVAAAVAYLRSPEGGAARSIVTVGFCFGGSSSWLQAAGDHDLAAAIGFYGRPLGPTRDGSPSPVDRASEFACPILGLFGGGDAGIPPDAVAAFDHALANAGVTHELHTYPDAPHSFFDRHYVAWADASSDAWQRILRFVNQHAA